MKKYLQKLRDKIKYGYKDIKTGISNVFYYLPIVFKDRQWDHGYLENIMLAKYKRWYIEYSSPNLLLPYEGIEKDLQAMRILIIILERRKSDWYTDGWYSKYAYREKSVFTPVEKGSIDGISGEEGLVEWTMEGLTKEESDKSYEWLLKYKQVEERDWRIFCDILKKYHNSMWD